MPGNMIGNMFIYSCGFGPFIQYIFYFPCGWHMENLAIIQFSGKLRYGIL